MREIFSKSSHTEIKIYQNYSVQNLLTTGEDANWVSQKSKNSLSAYFFQVNESKYQSIRGKQIAFSKGEVRNGIFHVSLMTSF